MPQSEESFTIICTATKRDDGEGFVVDIDANWNPEDRVAKDRARTIGAIGRVARITCPTPTDIFTRFQTIASDHYTNVFKPFVTNYDTNYPPET
nr:hypothetical protein 29 [bacterium]